MRRALTTILGAALVMSAVAAGPATQSDPGDVDHQMTLDTAEAVSYAGASDTGSANIWAHSSFWDGNTCFSDSPDNKCDRILIQVLEDGEATIDLTPTYTGMDYDLVVFESGKSGSAFNAIAQEQNEMRPIPGEGPVAVPGPESVTFQAQADMYYLAVVFYRAAGGGYDLTASLA